LHVPALHVAPLPHECPQAPQLFGSVCSSTHAPLHETSPLGHAHAPFWHVVPPSHAVRLEHDPVKLVPQYVLFVSGSTHEPPQISVSLGQAQWPPTHWYVESGHAEHATPP
jgi:hypothetical protein